MPENRSRFHPFALQVLLAMSQASSATTLSDDPNTAASVPSSACWVTLKDGLLSIEAQETDWADLFGELNRCTQIHIHRAEPLTGTLSPTLSRVPLRKALRQLFGPEADFIFRYPQHTRGANDITFPNEIWVLGPVTFTTRDQGLAKHNPQAVERVAAHPPPNPVASTDTDGKPSAAQHAENIDRLVDSTRGDNALQRMQAISALAGTADHTIDKVQSALNTALGDKDPNVQSQAVQAISQQRRPGADALLRQALHDTDPSVRLMAVDTADHSSEGLSLLQEALSDSDDTVRARAESKLKEIQNLPTSNPAKAAGAP